MQINTEWIAVNFDRFNKDYFGGRLTPPKFSVTNARTRLGSMAFKWKRSLLKRESYDYVIRLSNYYDIPEVEFQNVLLHEMIHYYIAVNRFKDDSVPLPSASTSRDGILWYVPTPANGRWQNATARNRLPGNAWSWPLIPPMANISFPSSAPAAFRK